MGTYTLLSALALLILPGAVAESGDGEANEPEPCDVLEVTQDPTEVAVEPECLPVSYAEESK